MTAMAKPSPNRDYQRRPDRAAPQPPDGVEVAIVGGGSARVPAARKLALQGARAVLLEAHTLGWGASTRSGGIAHPGFKWGPASMIKRYGVDLARALHGESQAALQLVSGLIRDGDIDAELRLNGWRELPWAPSHAADFPDE